MTDEAEAKLALLGLQLEYYVGSISIHIVGRTDALPDAVIDRPRDPARLGMERAMAAFSALIETSKLQGRLFTLHLVDRAALPRAKTSGAVLPRGP